MIMLKDKLLWYRKRKILLVLGLIHQCFCQLESGAVSIVLLRYYNESLKVENPKIFYGFAMSALLISAVISAKVSGIYMDKTRNIRRIAFVTIIFAMTGNFLYSLPFSKWLPIVGRLLCGFNEGLRTAIVGELSRVYDKEKLAKHLAIYEAASSFSVIFGPLTPLIFKDLHIHIGPLEINQYNAITIILGSIYGILWLICIFYLPNLTLDPEYEIAKNEIFIGDSEQGKETKTETKLLTTKDILRDYKMVLISEGFLSFTFNQTDLLTNMIALYDFSWSLSKLASMITSCLLLNCILMLITQRFIVSSPVNIFYLYMSCFALTAFSHSLINMIIALQLNETFIQIILYGIAFIAHLFQGFGSTAYCRWLLFAISPSHSASIIESHRYIVSRSCGFISFFTSGFVFPNLWFVLPLYNFISYIIIGSLSIKSTQILKKCEEKHD